jgi:phospholipid/cholesterol/gamma-HCH transport system permease protein
VTEPTPPAAAPPSDPNKTALVKPSSSAAVGRAIYRSFVVVGEPAVAFLTEIGRLGRFFLQVLFWLPRRPFRWAQLVRHMRDIGFGSMFIVALTGLFSGLSFGFLTLQGFGRLGMEALVGPTTMVGLAQALGPVLTGLMVAGRSGSGIATELGTMRVSEQIDALSTLAVEPIQYLVVPRTIAATLMMPLLVALFCATGLAGCYFIAWSRGVDPGVFWHETWLGLDPDDFYEGWIKAAFFGLQIGLISSYQGFNATGGARGVGEAATKAVVVSSVSILVGTYVLAEVLFPIIHGYLVFDALPK